MTRADLQTFEKLVRFNNSADSLCGWTIVLDAAWSSCSEPQQDFRAQHLHAHLLAAFAVADGLLTASFVIAVCPST